MFLGHESLAAIMTSRLKNLSVVARYWGDGDIKVSTLLYLFYLMRINCFKIALDIHIWM